MQPTDNRGGYRTPANPAPASGPGKLSRRTDGQPLRQLPNAEYGEQKNYQAQQRMAPAAESGIDVTAANAPSPVDMSQITPMNAPSQYPNEAVTAGADRGMGPSADALGLPTQAPIAPEVLSSLRDMLPALELMASNPMVSPEFRNFVRDVFAQT
jgi:hypothetical protein